MNSRISAEYVSMESRRHLELLIVTFYEFYKFLYSFLYHLVAIMNDMRKRDRHLVQYFWQCVQRRSNSRSLRTQTETIA